MTNKLAPVNQSTQLTDPFDGMLNILENPWFPMRSANLETFRLDVKENDKSYTVEAELPGVKKKDITLGLHDGRLTIGVAGKEVPEEDKKKLVHRERTYTYRERSIYLEDADCTGAEAKLEHGELVITIPKAAEKQNQKIEIN